MKKIIVFSDSHGDLSNMANVLDRETPDVVFHLGDHWQDAEEIEWAFPELTVYKVPGNCDWYNSQPATLKITLEGCTFLLCHGHTFGVKMGYSELAHYAADENVDVALFGHTHNAYSDLRGKVRLMNPGSCGMGREPSYGVIVADNGSAACAIHKVFKED